MSSSLTLRIAAALLATVALTGCGKKPGFVEPPQGRAADRFPGVYPNPALRPATSTTGAARNDGTRPNAGSTRHAMTSPYFTYRDGVLHAEGVASA